MSLMFREFILPADLVMHNYVLFEPTRHFNSSATAITHNVFHIFHCTVLNSFYPIVASMWSNDSVLIKVQICL